MILACLDSQSICLIETTEEDDPRRLNGSSRRRGPRNISQRAFRTSEHLKLQKIWLRGISTIVRGGKTGRVTADAVKAKLVHLL